VVTGIKANADGVYAVDLKNVQNGAPQELATDGLFIFIGFVPTTAWCRPASARTPTGTWSRRQVRHDHPGIYVIGDLRKNTPADRRRRGRRLHSGPGGRPLRGSPQGRAGVRASESLKTGWPTSRLLLYALLCLARKNFLRTFIPLAGMLVGLPLLGVLVGRAAP